MSIPSLNPVTHFAACPNCGLGYKFEPLETKETAPSASTNTQKPSAAQIAARIEEWASFATSDNVEIPVSMLCSWVQQLRLL